MISKTRLDTVLPGLRLLRDRFRILQRDCVQRDVQRSNRPEEPRAHQEGKRTPNSKTAKGAEEERGKTQSFSALKHTRLFIITSQAGQDLFRLLQGTFTTSDLHNFGHFLNFWTFFYYF